MICASRCLYPRNCILRGIIRMSTCLHTLLVYDREVKLQRGTYFLYISEFVFEKFCWRKCSLQALKQDFFFFFFTEFVNQHLIFQGILICQNISLVAQMVKRLSTMRETWVRSLGWEDPLEKEMAIYSSTIAWRIPWTEEPGRLQSMGSQRVRHD